MKPHYLKATGPGQQARILTLRPGLQACSIQHLGCVQPVLPALSTRNHFSTVAYGAIIQSGFPQSRGLWPASGGVSLRCRCMPGMRASSVQASEPQVFTPSPSSQPDLSLTSCEDHQELLASSLSVPAQASSTAQIAPVASSLAQLGPDNELIPAPVQARLQQALSTKECDEQLSLLLPAPSHPEPALPSLEKHLPVSAADTAVVTTTTNPAEESSGSPLRLWALAVLAATYMHQAATGFSIPIMLPMITGSLHLDDMQGAMLTSGYSYLYAFALVPMGMLADKSRRPTLLGAGVAGWSALSLVASHVHSFTELMVTRVGLAAAQSTQNVVCFSMIPDLFPKNKSTALAFYNCAIYLGRGIMYLAFNAAREFMAAQPESIDAASRELIPRDSYGNLLVPLDQLDLRLVQLVYTTGDMAAIRASSPLYGLSLAAETAGLQDTVWRQVLEKLAIPGAFLAAALLFTVPETPRSGKAAAAAVAASPAGSPAQDASPTNSPASAAQADSAPGGLAGILSLFKNKPFMTITAAAAVNDVANFALIAWQSTFYERVYHLEVTQYAPLLATILPISGIIGGVGGGLLADRLSLVGKRYWVTVATTFAAGPLIWASLTADTPDHSFILMAMYFALSEGWRAPSAVMARSTVPASQTSTAMSLYLCLRNVMGGLGPLAIAHLSSAWDLQHALTTMLPVMYLCSGAFFWSAEDQLSKMNPGSGASPGSSTSTPTSTSTPPTAHLTAIKGPVQAALARVKGAAGALARPNIPMQLARGLLKRFGVMDKQGPLLVKRKQTEVIDPWTVPRIKRSGSFGSHSIPVIAAAQLEERPDLDEQLRRRSSEEPATSTTTTQANHPTSNQNSPTNDNNTSQ